MVLLTDILPPSVVAASEELIDLFNGSFAAQLNTRLVGGASEPEYRPADEGCPFHRILFTQDYANSALHEIAHWCVAGTARRQQLDYGYWYKPDGRNAEEQQQFEQVEVKPQALEWLFANACGRKFRVSADNLNSDLGASELFKQRIIEQARHYCRECVNARAEQWISVLRKYYATPCVLQPGLYRMEYLL